MSKFHTNVLCYEHRAFTILSKVIFQMMIWISKTTPPMALDGVPASIELASVKSYLSSLPGVIEVHDLHGWAMSTSETALTVRLVISDGHQGDDFLSRVADELHEDFAIEHATIQIEMNNQSCVLSTHT